MTEPVTLGHIALNPLPKSGVSDGRKTAKVVVGALSHVGLNHLRHHKGYDDVCMCSHCLCIVCLHLLQAFSAVFVGNIHVAEELGVDPIAPFISS